MLKSIGKMQRRLAEGGADDKPEVAGAESFSYFLGYKKSANSKEREEAAKRTVEVDNTGNQTSQNENDKPQKPLKP